MIYTHKCTTLPGSKLIDCNMQLWWVVEEKTAVSRTVRGAPLTEHSSLCWIFDINAHKVR